jgi:hypothetical protein
LKWCLCNSWCIDGHNSMFDGLFALFWSLINRLCCWKNMFCVLGFIMNLHQKAMCLHDENWNGKKLKRTILDCLKLHKNDWCSPLLFVNVMQLHYQGVILLLILKHYVICDVFWMFVLRFSFCVNLIVFFMLFKHKCWKNYEVRMLKILF